ncbi:MAG TPA: hypothetical protein VIL86_17660 [Tepidisphaeraceae bacterium]
MDALLAQVKVPVTMTDMAEGGKQHLASDLPAPAATPVDDVDPFDEVLIEHANRCWEAERENAQRLTNRETLILSAIAAIAGIAAYQIQLFRAKEDVAVVQSYTVLMWLKFLLTCSGFLFVITFFGLVGQPLVFPRVRSSALFIYRKMRLRSLEFVMRLQREQQRPSKFTLRVRDLSIKWRKSQESDKRQYHRSLRAIRKRASRLLALPRTFFTEPQRNSGFYRKLVFTRTYEAYLDIRASTRRKAQRLDFYQQFFVLGFIFLIAAIAVYMFRGD